MATLDHGGPSPTLRSLVHFDKLYIGGGHARHVRVELDPDSAIISNDLGVKGGVCLWLGLPRLRLIRQIRTNTSVETRIEHVAIVSWRSPKSPIYEVPRTCSTAETSRPLWVVGTVEHDVIPQAHRSAAHHVGIERKPAAESTADILKHLRITLEGV